MTERHPHFCDCDDCLNGSAGVRLDELKPPAEAPYVWKPAKGSLAERRATEAIKRRKAGKPARRFMFRCSD